LESSFSPVLDYGDLYDDSKSFSSF